MSARLFCKAGPLAGQECQIEAEASIGSHPDNGLVLSAPAIAEHHALIRYDDEMGCYSLEKLSQAELALDGEAVADRAPLQRLHVITLADEYDFFFQWSGQAPQRDEAASPPPQEAEAPSPAASRQPGEKTLLKRLKDVLAPPRFKPSEELSSPPSSPAPYDDEQLVTQPLGDESPGQQTNVGLSRAMGAPPSFEQEARPESAFVLELETLKGLESFVLLEGENDLGRSIRCRVSVNDATISRRHAILKVESGTVKVIDLGSTNKSYVDENVVEAETVVEPGVPLCFGRLKGCLRRTKE